MLFFSASSFKVKTEKSLIVRQIQLRKAWNRFNRVWTCIIHPIHLHKRVWLYFQSVKPLLRKVHACSIKTFHSHGIQESTHLVSLIDRSYNWKATDFQIFFTIANALTILAFSIEAAAAHGLLILFWPPPSILGYIRPGGSNCLISLTAS